MTYQDRLAQLDSSLAAMIDAGDIAGLQDRLVKACVFAACTAHTSVEQAEREYAEWIDTGEFPTDGTNLSYQKASAVMTARRLAALHDDVADFRVDGWTMARRLQENVYGLGTAKASFAAAIMGYPEPYCLDTHGLQLIASRTGADLSVLLQRVRTHSRRPREYDRAWEQYRRWGDTAFGTRDHQWEYFALKVPAFREGGHETYFRTVLQEVAS